MKGKIKTLEELEFVRENVNIYVYTYITGDKHYLEFKKVQNKWYVYSYIDIPYKILALDLETIQAIQLKMKE